MSSTHPRGEQQVPSGSYSPAGGTVPAPDTAAPCDPTVERGGRSVQVWTAAAYATGALVLPIYAWLDSQPWQTSAEWFDTTNIFLLGLAGILWILFLVRFWSRNVFERSVGGNPTKLRKSVRSWTSRTWRSCADGVGEFGSWLWRRVKALGRFTFNKTESSDTKKPERPRSPAQEVAVAAAAAVPQIAAPTGTIICCSGGGIKSASFCLGALQALDEAGIYGDASHVIGVSGGGYIAGAYAAHQYPSMRSTPSEPVFDRNGSEIAELRSRTDYLAPSRQARLDLALSVLFGIFTNVLIVGAVLTLLAWVLGEQIIGDQVMASTDAFADLGSHSFWLPQLVTLLLFVVPIFMFLAFRLGSTDSSSARHRRRSRAKRGDRLNKNVLWLEWWANLPSRLLFLGIAILLLYPGVIFAARWLDGLRSGLESAFSGVHLDLVATLAAITAFVGLVRSASKGINQPNPETVSGKVLLFFRRQIAPRVGVAIVFIGTYVLLVDLTKIYVKSVESGPVSGWIFPATAAVMLVLAFLLGSANSTSLFPFYLDRLKYAFFNLGRPAASPAADAEGTSVRQKIDLNRMEDPGPRIPTFSDLEAAHRAAKGHPASQWPELVLVSTANVKDGGILPSGRNGTPFIFSNEVFGFTSSSLPGGAMTCAPSTYENPPYGERRCDVAMAVAISGAAISPLAGREDKTIRSYRVLLALANVRLGVWLRNPHWTRELPRSKREVGGSATRRACFLMGADRFLDRLSPYKVIQEAFGRLSIFSPYLFLTDGGHYDNLGLVEALRRRPSRIIMLDGSGDPEDKFPAMGMAIATARMDQGVEVDFKPAPLMRGEGKYPKQGWVRAEATYSGGGKCVIDYVKCVLPERFPWDLESYRLQNPGFPTDTFKFETYDEFDFEAYRQLGWSLIQTVENADWGQPPTSLLAAADIRLTNGQARGAQLVGRRGRNGAAGDRAE